MNLNNFNIGWKALQDRNVQKISTFSFILGIATMLLLFFFLVGVFTMIESLTIIR